MSTKAVGDRAEALAAQHLERIGYRILARNYRVRGGELDLVAQKEGVLCFVEVRSKTSARHGAPAETIDRGKRERIARAAEHYLATRGMPGGSCRFDVVAILGGSEIEVITDAFRVGD